jgi:hypothetical protein
MVEQIAGPGVQDAEQPDLPADEAGIGGQLLDGRGGTAEEQVVKSRWWLRARARRASGRVKVSIK